MIKDGRQPKLNVRNIAAEAGVSHTTLYRNHPDLIRQIEGAMDKNQVPQLETQLATDLRREVRHLKNLCARMAAKAAFYKPTCRKLLRELGNKRTNLVKFDVR